MVKPFRYHFIGIGGCGMSGLAQVLAQQGHKVTGSDQESCDVIQRLGQWGISVQIGHEVKNVPADVDCVVASAAIPEENVEWQYAQKQGVKLCKYAELLGELSKTMKTIAIAGTHGKSTTSGWVSQVLHHAGLDPSFVVGADVSQLGGGSGAGQGESLVVEACEYDRSFLNLHPWAAAILNIEADHLDYYKDIDEIIEAFAEFILRIRPGGILVVNADDANALRALELAGGKEGLAAKEIRCEFYGLENQADWGVEKLDFVKGHGCFDLVAGGDVQSQIRLGLSGRHNVSNSLAAAALAHAAGVSFEALGPALESYRGVGRRMSYKGQVDGITILDDYAHHPTEIQATLEAISCSYLDTNRPGRIWCIFQPHQHSRTRFFLNEFASSFSQADIILLPDIYFVRESEQLRRAVNARDLARLIRERGGRSRYLGSFDRIVRFLVRSLRGGDVVVTMGAGDVWKVADELIGRLQRNREI